MSDKPTDPFETPLVFSYVRVSGKGQLEKDGPDRQREAVGKFCLAQGITNVGEFFEKAVSGTVEAVDRPTFAEMLEYVDARAGTGQQICGIVVERMDRLARDLMVSELLLAECRKRNLKVFAADQGALIDMAAADCDPTRVLIRQILGALAQWEKTMLVSKLRSARERKRAKTGKCEGARKYGYFPGEQDIINLMHNFRATVDIHGIPMEFARIAQYLNESGFRNRSGKPWCYESVRWIYNTSTPTKVIEIE